MRIVAGDGRVDLHRHAQVLQIAETGNGGIERARNAAERVVGKRIGAVEADGNALYAAVDDLLRDMLCDQRSVGCQRHAQAFVRAISRQLENIGAEKWLTAAQNQNRIRYLGDLIDDVAGRLGGKIGTGELSSVALARQWMQRRLQPLVNSQKINRGLFDCV